MTSSSPSSSHSTRLPMGSVLGPRLGAWVDESMRTLGDGSSIYVLAAAIGDPDACGPVREVLRSLLDERQPRLHWRDESYPRRSKIAAAIGQLDLVSVVVVGMPLDKSKQERGRRICMETLYPDLCARRVTTIWQEARTPSLNANDMKMIDALRGKRVLPATVRVEFAQPREEPMLWVPDAVAGAVGAARIGESEDWLAEMGDTVTQLEVPLR